MTDAVAVAAPRRHDLDALRALAMLLGIALHASLSFFPVPWPAQDTQQSEWFGLFNAAVHGFRMPLFFILAGFFTMMVYRQRGLAALVKQRAVRILAPCLVGVCTIVPALHLVSAWAVSTSLPTGDRDQQPLIAAIRSGDLAELRRVLEPGLDVHEPDTTFKCRPLQWACMVGDPAAVRLLLDHGADVNEPNGDGNLPLHSAAFLGHDRVVALLLERGADPSRVNREGTPPLAATEAPEAITAAVLGFLGLPQPKSDELMQGRGRVRKLLAAHLAALDQAALDRAAHDKEAPPSASASATTGPADWAGRYAAWINSDALRVNLAGMPVHLVNAPTFGHLWFLWFLCWLVGWFAVVALCWGRGRSQGAADAPRSWWPLWLLVPLTAVPQWFMGVAFPQLGPDTSSGLLPAPHILAYYAIFFAFGGLYFDRHDAQGKLGRWWWLLLPLALLIVLPACIVTLGDRPWSTLLQPLYAWMMSIGLIGLFRATLSQPRPAMRYLSDASYWMYLVHLPLIIWAQALIRTWPLPALAKFLLLNLAAVAVLLVTYRWLVRHSWIGRVLNGPRKRSAAPRMPIVPAAVAVAE